MNRRTLLIRYVACIAASLGFCVVLGSAHPRAAVAPAVLNSWCDDPEICSESAPCDTECTNRDVIPSQFITCGDYNGGWEAGYCENGCGDTTCDENYEDAESCVVDCGYCGDGVCFEETASNCSEDCSCGDGLCDLSESCTYCEDDCGACGGTPDCSDPGQPDSCGSGSICNSARSCCEAVHIDTGPPPGSPNLDCQLCALNGPDWECLPHPTTGKWCVYKGPGCSGS